MKTPYLNSYPMFPIAVELGGCRFIPKRSKVIKNKRRKKRGG